MERFCKICDNNIRYAESMEALLITECTICKNITILEESNNIIFSNKENTTTDLYSDVLSLTPYDPTAM